MESSEGRICSCEPSPSLVSFCPGSREAMMPSSICGRMVKATSTLILCTAPSRLGLMASGDVMYSPRNLRRSTPWHSSGSSSGLKELDIQPLALIRV